MHLVEIFWIFLFIYLYKANYWLKLKANLMVRSISYWEQLLHFQDILKKDAGNFIYFSPHFKAISKNLNIYFLAPIKTNNSH